MFKSSKLYRSNYVLCPSKNQTKQQAVIICLFVVRTCSQVNFYLFLSIYFQLLIFIYTSIFISHTFIYSSLHQLFLHVLIHFMYLLIIYLCINNLYMFMFIFLHLFIQISLFSYFYLIRVDNRKKNWRMKKVKYIQELENHKFLVQ